MGTYLDRARAHFGRDTSGMLEGGRYALLHTRTLEFDELRPYVPGDDVRDIDWKATARSGHTLIKRFVSEKHHKILVIVDAGSNTAALTPSGEYKRDVAAHLIGAVGLITLKRSDQIGMVFGDARGCVDIRLRRGEAHIEGMLHRFYDHATMSTTSSHVVTQLDWVARHYRRPLLVFVVSDEPDVTDRLGEVLRTLTAAHQVIWAMVADLPAVDSTDNGRGGLDVGSRRFVPSGAALGAEVVAAYRAAEAARRADLADLLNSHGVVHTTVAGSPGIRAALMSVTGVLSRAR